MNDPKDPIHTTEYINLMNKRIKYAMNQRVLMGCVPYEDELDLLFPLPERPNVIKPKSWNLESREAGRDRSYGICGIGIHRNRWVARIDRSGRVTARYFHRAKDAALWYNKIELKHYRNEALLCCVSAAEMLDTKELTWGHVLMCRRGTAEMKPEILLLLKDRIKWDARHTTS